MNSRKKTLYDLTKTLCLVLAAAIISCGSPDQEQKVESRVERLPYYNSPEFTPVWLSGRGDSLADFHRIPEFQLTNQKDVFITEDSLTGKICVADFFFTTCPGICPKMTDNMMLVQDAFKDDRNVLILSHSVTPEMDSVSVLQSYAEAKGITSPQWHLLTGNRELIYNLGRKFYFVEEDLGVEKSDNEFLHTENFVLIDQNRHIRGIYNGLNKTSVNQLIADIRTLKQS